MAQIGKPVPAITPGMAEFFAGAKRGQLMAEKCEGCGLMRFPAMEMCWNCNSTHAHWAPVSGRGEVFSFNIMHQVYHPAFAAEVPYAVVVVQLEEGPRMLSNLVGIKPHDIKCGMPVEVVFEKLSDEVTIPKFKVRSAA